jgi:anti-sigma-K factor RsiG
MAEATTDGASRTARVLDPEFVKALEELSTEEVRRRRDEALAEREFQSYFRRLVQVRQDLLQQEHARRSSGGEPGSLVDRITGALSEGPKGRGRGEALRLQIPEAELAEAQRRADDIIGEARVSHVEELEDAELDALLPRIAGEERSVSSDRAAVIQVHDRLQEELKRRYRQNPGQVLDFE